MKKLIDANVILRYLLGDHPQMSEKAKKVIEAGAFTLPEVLAEVVYVLKGIYKVERAEIAKVLIDFLDEISIENQDFVDCVLIARHRILGDEVVSFDKKLSNRL